MGSEPEGDQREARGTNLAHRTVDAQVWLMCPMLVGQERYAVAMVLESVLGFPEHLDHLTRGQPRRPVELLELNWQISR